MAVNVPFTLSFALPQAPAFGYTGIQSEIDYGALVYKPDTAANEIVWPPSQGGLELRSPAAPLGTEGSVAHAAASGLIPPRPVSNFTGNLVEITLTCTAVGSEVVDLLPFDAATNTNGSGTADDAGNVFALGDTMD
ncbi:MAG: hypothetical protein U1B78_04500, partial [Dehalococcoidia bacterium]|nr:hypothetical protein [Dehalococcoidia bacterium]